MGFFDFLQAPDVNQGVAEQASVTGSILLDVRTPEEYRGGHIPGSQNMPLQVLDKIEEWINDRNTPMYVCCQSGSRSRQAAALLQSMGYRNVKDIGGIAAWRGRMEK